MDDAIKIIAQSLKEEAEAVISYTDKLKAIAGEGDAENFQALALIRIDEVEHIQKLTIELTRLLTAGVKEITGLVDE